LNITDPIATAKLARSKLAAGNLKKNEINLDLGESNGFESKADRQTKELEEL
jgi:hypothetical protein